MQGHTRQAAASGPFSNLRSGSLPPSSLGGYVMCATHLPGRMRLGAYSCVFHSVSLHLCMAVLAHRHELALVTGGDVAPCVELLLGQAQRMTV